MKQRCFYCETILIRETKADIENNDGILQAYVCNNCGKIYYEKINRKRVTSINGRENREDLYNRGFGTK
jgi:uncharacterized protein with PIN domain